MRFFRTLTLCFVAALTSACFDDVPIGPVSHFEGTPIGLKASYYTKNEIIDDKTYLYPNGTLVGVIRDFVPENWKSSPKGWRSLHYTELFYDLNSRLVFEIRTRLKSGFFEADCTRWGEIELKRYTKIYKNVRIQDMGKEYGAIWIMPAGERDDDMYGGQNVLRMGCPLGFTLTPHIRTNYEYSLTNGELHARTMGR